VLEPVEVGVPCLAVTLPFEEVYSRHAERHGMVEVEWKEQHTLISSI